MKMVSGPSLVKQLKRFGYEVSSETTFHTSLINLKNNQVRLTLRIDKPISEATVSNILIHLRLPNYYFWNNIIIIFKKQADWILLQFSIPFKDEQFFTPIKVSCQ
jgi:hypothetical protein